MLRNGHQLRHRLRTTLNLLLAIGAGLAFYTVLVEFAGYFSVDNWRSDLLRHIQ